MYELPDSDDKISYFNFVALTLFDEHTPIKIKHFNKPQAPWIIFLIRQMMRLRDRAYSRFNRVHTFGALDYYKSLRNLDNSSLCGRSELFLIIWLRIGIPDFYGKISTNSSLGGLELI